MAASDLRVDVAGTYSPAIYDAVTPPSFQGDVEWYRQQAIESGGPVLELGAGTGRITLPMAAAGVPVWALDASPIMLDALRKKLEGATPDVRNRVTPVEADMRTFTIPERFPLIIAPFRAFLHNLTDDDRLACLARVRAHLRPDGRFAFNVFHPSLEFMSRHAGALAGVWRWAGTYPFGDDGFVVRSEANRYDTVRQVVHSLHRYDEYTRDGVLVTSSVHRLELAYLYPGDIEHLLTRAGFQQITIHGGFQGAPFSRDAEELVLKAS